MASRVSKMLRNLPQCTSAEQGREPNCALQNAGMSHGQKGKLPGELNPVENHQDGAQELRALFHCISIVSFCEARFLLPLALSLLLCVFALWMLPLHTQSSVCVSLRRNLLPKSFLVMLDTVMRQGGSCFLVIFPVHPEHSRVQHTSPLVKSLERSTTSHRLHLAEWQMQVVQTRASASAPAHKSFWSENRGKHLTSVSS